MPASVGDYVQVYRCGGRSGVKNTSPAFYGTVREVNGNNYEVKLDDFIQARLAQFHYNENELSVFDRLLYVTEGPDESKIELV